MCDLLIVGAGLCGLLAAAGCAGRGQRIVILDKEAGAGGRLATEAMDGGLADSGAQFFTARRPDFTALVKQWQDAGLVYRWSTGWSDGLVAAPSDGRPRFAVHGGMAALARHLLEQAQTHSEIHTHFGVDVSRVSVADDAWQVDCADGSRFFSRAVALTAPPPQALALLDAGSVPLAGGDRAALARLDYEPCLAALFHIAGDAALPEPGAVQRPGAPVTWMADNRRKGISPGATIITAHGGPEWSRAWYDEDDRDVLAYMEMELAPFLTPGATIQEARLRRWRCALARHTHPQPALVAAGLPPLYLGGDAFGSPRIEGAALSGLHVAWLYNRGETA